MDLESQLIGAQQRLDGLLRDVRAGAMRGPVLIKLLALTYDLTNHLLEQTAQQIKDTRP